MAALAAIAALYLLLFLQQASQPYTIDEAAFPYGAAGILERGVPQFYNGETRPADMGLWHPPLYIYALAVNMAVLGDSVIAVRILGLFAVLVAWFIGLRILRGWYPGSRGGGAARIAFSAAFLLNPLILSGSLVPDIDGTLGIVVAMAFLWLLTKVIRGNGGAQLMLLSSLVWFVAFSTKFTIALLMVPVTVIAVLLAKKERRQSLVRLTVGFVVGGCGFLAVWLLVARVLGADFFGPFSYFATAFTSRGPGASPTAKLIATLTNESRILLWVGPALVVVALLSTAIVVWRPRIPAERRLAVFNVLTAGLVLAAYAAITGVVFTFPKYWGVMVPSLALLVGMGAYRLGGQAPWAWFGLYGKGEQIFRGALSLGLLGVGLLWGFKALTQSLEFRSLTPGWVLGIWLKLSVLFLVGLLILFVSRGSLATVNHPASVVAKFAFGALLGSLLLLQITADLVIRSADYSTRYYFGERGLEEVVTQLKGSTPFDARILAAKDVGLQSERPFFEDAMVFYEKSPVEFEQFLAAGDLDAVVTRANYDYSASIFPEQFRLISEYFRPADVQPSPDFTIWVPLESTDRTRSPK